ncbi:ATPase AAA [Clostridia bacterium]|nr:ATPase AAA [Clostridia bacterium]
MMYKNPFTPVFGNEPPILAGRQRMIQDVITGLDNGPGDPNRVTIFTGPRGSGKTVLLATIAAAAESMGWISVHATAMPGMLDMLIEQIEEKGAEFLSVEQSGGVTGVQVSGFGITRELPDRKSVSFRTRASRYLKELEEQHIGLLITVDEVSADVPEMITLIDSFQHFIRERREIALLMAGLPNNVLQMFQHESISYLRRAFRKRLDSVSIPEVRMAIEDTVKLTGRTIDREALSVASEATNGFPFLIQLVGFYMFSQSDRKKISLEDAERGIEIAKIDMERMIIDSTVRALSDRDMDFLEAMSRDEEYSNISDVAKRIGASASLASHYKRRLAEQGIISSVGRGKIAFNIPMLKTWLRERGEQ